MLALASSLLLAACGDSAAGSDSTECLSERSATPTEQIQAVVPARIQLDMLDFSFQLGGPIEAGEVNIKVNDHGVQLREWVLFKVDEGKIFEDMQAFLAEHKSVAGPTPGTEAGGALAISTHGSEVITMNLEARHYVAACYLPDPDSDKSHAEPGMIQEFTVSWLPGRHTMHPTDRVSRWGIRWGTRSA